jgi:hypothetical protein
MSRVSVHVILVTTSWVSKKGKIFPPSRTCLTYSAISKLIFNVAIHKFWGRVLAKFQEARSIAYADDGYIKGKLSVSVFDVVHIIISVSPTLTHLRGDVSLASFCPEGFVGIGVPIYYR